MPEYRSNTEIGGIPLVHMVSGEGGKTGVARGWIAIGDVAFGVVFAAGGLAIGGITLGGASPAFPLAALYSIAARRQEKHLSGPAP